MSDAHDRAVAAVNRLAKWRTLLTGWQLGTRAKGDPESDAVRHHREATLVLRAEVNAVTRLLIDKGVVTPDEWADALREEADALNEGLEHRFPGVRATDDGLVIDHRASEWMSGWKR